MMEESDNTNCLNVHQREDVLLHPLSVYQILDLLRRWYTNVSELCVDFFC